MSSVTKEGKLWTVKLKLSKLDPHLHLTLGPTALHALHERGQSE